MAPKPRRETQDTPDSLPKREEGTDVIPDDVRRTDPPQRILPDSLPPLDEQSIERADGGVRTTSHSTTTISRIVISEGFEREIDDGRRLVRTAGFGRYAGGS